MGNVSSHTYTYAGKRSFACNCEENNGKCGLAPPNNRFERTHGTSPFAAQPNVRRTRYWRACVTRKNPPTNNSPHKISLCEAKKCSVYTELRIEKILCCENFAYARFRNKIYYSKLEEYYETKKKFYFSFGFCVRFGSC